jgi:UDP-N-acetylmuramate dehydrogenase
MPAFPAPAGQVKLSAAWLIERAGFKRGFVHGNVGTSSKHSLAIINRGGGTAREVIELKNLLQAGVLEKFGVRLVPEPVFVGFEETA